MPLQFPHFFVATTVTLAAGALTSLVRAAMVPAPHPVAPVGLHAVGVHVVAPPQMTRGSLPGNLVNTPTSTGPAFPPYNPNLAVGASAAPAVTQGAAYGQAAMNQPGQPPFGETFVSNQTAMGQPGQADFYEGMANPNVLQANQGIQPSNAYPHPVSPQTGVPSAATNAAGFGLTQGPNTVGFYSGFGPGVPDWGFYEGFTTPR
jgi:hypothetical protein